MKDAAQFSMLNHHGNAAAAREALEARLFGRGKNREAFGRATLDIITMCSTKTNELALARGHARDMEHYETLVPHLEKVVTLVTRLYYGNSNSCFRRDARTKAFKIRSPAPGRPGQREKTPLPSTYPDVQFSCERSSRGQEVRSQRILITADLSQSHMRPMVPANPRSPSPSRGSRPASTQRPATSPRRGPRGRQASGHSYGTCKR
jgi:hypothetical protein